MQNPARQRIAVIGSGISGLAAAYFLSRRHEVYLFEKEDRLGGHTHTHWIDDPAGPLPIDTGFIVHNQHTYPNLIRLLAELKVETQWSDMSFGVSCRQSGFEYSSRGLRGFFAQRSNLVSPRHYRFFTELLRFNRRSRELLGTPAMHGLTLGEYLEWERFSDDFTGRYLYPMAAAVWSTSLDEIRHFPALTLIRFFQNHGFLGIDTQFRWRSVVGGSSQYIAPITEPYRARIATGAQITAVLRYPEAVEIQFRDRAPLRFDQVVFATHGNQVLPLLADSTPEEREIMAAFRTSPSKVWLHTDSAIMPRRPDAWASWNYHIGRSDTSAQVAVTYHMNRLQSLRTSRDYFVTLNAVGRVRPETVLREMSYSHPLYTLDAIRAQQRWAEISGRRRTHYCGAYWYYGFHEDGLRSALHVAEALGVNWTAPGAARDPEPAAMAAAAGQD